MGKPLQRSFVALVEALDLNPDEVLSPDVGRWQERLSEIRGRDGQVLGYRFPLDGSAALSRKDIGALLELSGERVRQIEQRALARLKKDLVSAGLIPAQALARVAREAAARAQSLRARLSDIAEPDPDRAFLAIHAPSYFKRRDALIKRWARVPRHGGAF